MRLAYLVHDLSDPAVARRVAMLQRGGADVVLAGFHRADEAPGEVGGTAPIALGRTHDARMVNRALMVARTSLAAGRLASRIGQVDAILSRNLEMLAIGARLARWHHALPLAYEVLDVHRLALAGGAKGRAVRTLEGRLARSAHVLLTSSPAFVREYFEPLSQVRLPVRLVENKVLEGTVPSPAAARAAGPPWRIGLFGALRCRRSIDLLAELAERQAGRVEVVVRGRPSPAVFTDLAGELERRRNIRYLGPYRNPDDLAAIYDDVHFVWSIDYYEAGANSEWLLPNRVYEGGLYGAVPIAARGTETARLLDGWGAGVCLEEPVEAPLNAMFAGLDQTRYAKEAGRIAAVPRTAFVATEAECRELVHAIVGGNGTNESTRHAA